MDDTPNYRVTQGAVARAVCRRCGRQVGRLVNGRLEPHQDVQGAMCPAGGEFEDGRGPRGLPAQPGEE